jgi:hypothetical protein
MRRKSTEMAKRIIDILSGVWAGLLAQMLYDVIANAGNPTEWQDRFEAGTVLLVILGFLIVIGYFVTKEPKVNTKEMSR